MLHCAMFCLYMHRDISIQYRCSKDRSQHKTRQRHNTRFVERKDRKGQTVDIFGHRSLYYLETNRPKSSGSFGTLEIKVYRVKVPKK